MTVEIEVKGIEQVNNFLKNKSKDIEKGTEEGIKKATLHTQNEVKLSIAGHRAEKTSVDTGRFLNSVDINLSKDFGIVFSDVEYAKFLEFGTSKLQPRMHFRNSLFRNQRKINEIIRKEIKQVTS